MSLDINNIAQGSELPVQSGQSQLAAGLTELNSTRLQLQLAAVIVLL